MASALAFLVGRRKRNGDVRLEVAQHELKKAIEAGDAAQKKVDVLRTKQLEIASDIVEEAARRTGINSEWEKLSDDEVNARLRALGLLK